MTKLINVCVFFNDRNAVANMLLDMTQEIGQFWSVYKRETDFDFAWEDENNHDEMEHRLDIFVKFRTDENVEMYGLMYRVLRTLAEKYDEAGKIGSYVSMVADDMEFEDAVMDSGWSEAN